MITSKKEKKLQTDTQCRLTKAKTKNIHISKIYTICTHKN